jgi:putative ABC transport system permease protein
VFRQGDAAVAREIVGVVADLKHDSLAGERAPEVYVPAAQHVNSWMFAAVRAGVEPRPLALALRAAVREVDPDQPIHNVMLMRQRLEESVAPHRFNAALLASFAAVALLLASVGVFGVMSYTVAQRTHEIGIRMALGALPRDISRLIVGHGLKLALAGGLLGVAAAYALTRLMAGLLFEVRPTDPAVFAGIALLLAVAALVACYLPSRRAARVDPLVALRDE